MDEVALEIVRHVLAQGGPWIAIAVLLTVIWYQSREYKIERKAVADASAQTHKEILAMHTAFRDELNDLHEKRNLESRAAIETIKSVDTALRNLTDAIVRGR